MKSKQKQKNIKKKGNKPPDDMDKILQDPRFSHIPFDPKLRSLPKKARKINIDSRFSSMFSDDKFHEKSTMDPRGRKGNFSTKEDLRKFYHLSSDEDESDDEEYLDSDNDQEEQQKSESESSDEKRDNDDEDNSEKKCDDTDIAEVDDIVTDDVQPRKDKTERVKEIEERLKDVTQDYTRGVMMFSDDSSDDETSVDEEEEEVEFEWGELDQDAVWDNEQDFEETSRIAVCNLDWVHIKAVDIQVVFSSFCPRGGSIRKVSIYQSEFGKQRMEEEDQFGPKELTSQKIDTSAHDDIDLDRLEKGKLDKKSGKRETRYEALRRYERNRLRYFYAVVECDSVETAMAVYKDCDRQSFEMAGICMDLRYIPDDMTFDETPHDMCNTVPEFYEPKYFKTTALSNGQPTLSWDQTDPARQKAFAEAMKHAVKGNNVNEDYIKNFIASSSESDEEQDDEDGDFSSEDDEEAKATRIAKFRALIHEIDKKEKKKANPFDMEQVFGEKSEDGIGNETSSNEDETEMKDMNPFERYLEKRKARKREFMEKKKSKREMNESEVTNRNKMKKDEISDDDIPENIYNDPFFAEEIGEKPKKSEKPKRKNKKVEEKETKEMEQGDLELLLMDEDREEKRHFSMRDIIDEHKGKSKKLKKKARLRLEEKLKEKNAVTDDFKIDTCDSRFSSLLQSDDFNIDPSHPQFKRTKAMDDLISNVQKKRIAESFENV
ncbi:pre-rRNA-processing protein esf1, partial [Halocaridina rubra]